MSKIKLVVTAGEKAVLERIAAKECDGIPCSDCPLDPLHGGCAMYSDEDGRFNHKIVAAKYLATCEVEVGSE